MARMTQALAIFAGAKVFVNIARNTRTMIALNMSEGFCHITQRSAGAGPLALRCSDGLSYFCRGSTNDATRKNKEFEWLMQRLGYPEYSPQAFNMTATLSTYVREFQT